MQTLPSLEDFKVFSQKYDVIAVKAEFTADAETPSLPMLNSHRKNLHFYSNPWLEASKLVDFPSLDAIRKRS